MSAKTAEDQAALDLLAQVGLEGRLREFREAAREHDLLLFSRPWLVEVLARSGWRAPADCSCSIDPTSCPCANCPACWEVQQHAVEAP